MDTVSQISFGGSQTKTRPASILKQPKAREHNETPELDQQILTSLVKFNFPLSSLFSSPTQKLNPNRDLIKQHSPFLNASLLVDPELGKKKKIPLNHHAKSRLTKLTLEIQPSSFHQSSRSNGENHLLSESIAAEETEILSPSTEIKLTTQDRIRRIVERLQPRDEAENSSDSADEEIYQVNEEAERQLTEGGNIVEIIREKRRKLRRIFVHRKFSQMQRQTQQACNDVYSKLHRLGYQGRIHKNDFTKVKAKYESLPPLEKPSISLIQRRVMREAQQQSQPESLNLTKQHPGQKQIFRQKVENETMEILVSYLDQVIAKTPDQSLVQNFDYLRQLFLCNSYKDALTLLHQIQTDGLYKKFRLGNSATQPICMKDLIFAIESVEVLSRSTSSQTAKPSMEPSSVYYQCLSQKCINLQRHFSELAKLIAENGIEMKVRTLLSPRRKSVRNSNYMDAETFAEKLDAFKKDFYERKLLPYYKADESERSEVEAEDQLSNRVIRYEETVQANTPQSKLRRALTNDGAPRTFSVQRQRTTPVKQNVTTARTRFEIGPINIIGAE